MKVYLQKNVTKVGQKGEVHEVSAGYADNCLFPQGLAVPATEKHLKAISSKKDSANKQKEDADKKVYAAYKALSGIIELRRPHNDEGVLFSEVHSKDVISAIQDKVKIELAEDAVLLDNKIKHIGAYVIKLKTMDKNLQLELKIL
jgi:large subunit ribosomal protein L9